MYCAVVWRCWSAWLVSASTLTVVGVAPYCCSVLLMLFVVDTKSLSSAPTDGTALAAFNFFRLSAVCWAPWSNGWVFRSTFGDGCCCPYLTRLSIKSWIFFLVGSYPASVNRVVISFLVPSRSYFFRMSANFWAVSAAPVCWILVMVLSGRPFKIFE